MTNNQPPIFTALQKIEGVASTIEMRARWLADDVNELVNLPAWETQAEDGLAKAEQSLQRSLSVVQQAGDLLKKKRQPKAETQTN